MILAPRGMANAWRRAATNALTAAQQTRGPETVTALQAATPEVRHLVALLRDTLERTAGTLRATADQADQLYRLAVHDEIARLRAEAEPERPHAGDNGCEGGIR